MTVEGACTACGKYLLTRMPGGWRCAGCRGYQADKDDACVSCGKPGEINCDSCFEVICLECIDTHAPACEEAQAEAERQKPIERAERAELMAHELAAKLALVLILLEDQGLPVPECPEMVKYNRLYHSDGTPRD
jgi:hypothetical protein